MRRACRARNGELDDFARARFASARHLARLRRPARHGAWPSPRSGGARAGLSDPADRIRTIGSQHIGGGRLWPRGRLREVVPHVWQRSRQRRMRLCVAEGGSRAELGRSRRQSWAIDAHATSTRARSRCGDGSAGWVCSSARDSPGTAGPRATRAGRSEWLVLMYPRLGAVRRRAH